MLTHFDKNGNAQMVDVSEKSPTTREATAQGVIMISREVYEAIAGGTAKKGDVLGVARIAGIMAAKRTSELVPLCHPLPLTKVSLDFELVMEEFKGGADGKTPDKYSVVAICTAKTNGVTGVEMEALTGVNVALLTIYDMCKAIDKRMVMTDIHLVEKTGGKSGHFVFDDYEED